MSREEKIDQLKRKKNTLQKRTVKIRHFMNSETAEEMDAGVVTMNLFETKDYQIRLHSKLVWFRYFFLPSRQLHPLFIFSLLHFVVSVEYKTRRLMIYEWYSNETINHNVVLYFCWIRVEWEMWLLAKGVWEEFKWREEEKKTQSNTNTEYNLHIFLYIVFSHLWLFVDFLLFR